MPTPLPIRLTQARNSGAIVFTSVDGKALRLLRPDGNAPTDLVRLDPAGSAVIAWYSIRPNSRNHIYYVAPQDNREPYGEAFLLRSGVSRKLNIPVFYGGRWSPDGSRLSGFIYDSKDANNGSAYVYDFALESGYLLPFNGSADWSPDQTQLVFAMAVYTCRNAGERVMLQPYNIYTWDATLDANAPFITVPGFVVEGKNPTWIADDLQ